MAWLSTPLKRGVNKRCLIAAITRYKCSISMLNIRRETAEHEIQHLFCHAARTAPSVVILEDMDSLTKESRVTRSALLSHLDGLGSKEGLLIVGTTNNPGDVDPALIHRPSRFDRVWRFEVPDCALRYGYLEWAFHGIDRQILYELAEQTDGWSFAYLNELRTTAAIRSLDRKSESIREGDLQEAFNLLLAQFHAGRKNHVTPQASECVGFKVMQ